MYKKDELLGKNIKNELLSKGVETPMKDFQEYDFDKISFYFNRIMQEMNLDVEDDSLRGTPDRFAKLYTQELFYGLDYRNFPKATTVENKMKYDEMVSINNINVSSMCEHHFITIDGVCNIAYIPEKKVLGLSKFNRIVDFFSRRPQIQERLTEQIYYALAFILGTENIAVNIKAVHHCVKSRGVCDTNSYTITNKLGGEFKKIELRNEYFNSIK